MTVYSCDKMRLVKVNGEISSWVTEFMVPYIAIIYTVALQMKGRLSD